MGLRFRKSFCYRGMRVNFSKSGIGASWGVPGFRYTLTADGRERVTLSIPGTGISWVEESSVYKKKNDQYNTAVQSGNLHSFVNSNTQELTSSNYKEFTKECEKYIKDRKLYSYLFFGSVILSLINVLLAFATAFPLFWAALAIVCATGGIWSYANKQEILNNKIRLEYSFDSAPNPLTKLETTFSKGKHSSHIWCVNYYLSNIQSRVNAGTTNNYNLHSISIAQKTPYFINSNITPYYFKLPDTEMYVFPDKILLVVKKTKVGAIDLDSVNMVFSQNDFRYFGSAPKDSQILGYTYKYVNNNGTLDRRYKDNFQVPICKFCQIDITSPEGLNLRVFSSNFECGREFVYKWQGFENYIPDNDIGRQKENNRQNKSADKPLDDNNSEFVDECIILLSGTELGKRIHVGNSEVRFLLGEIGVDPLICFGLNPSTANEMEDDPTIRKIKQIAHENDKCGWIMLNLYPQRTSKPDELDKILNSRYHEINLKIIDEVLQNYPFENLLAAWGDSVSKRDYLKQCLADIVKLDNTRQWCCRGGLTQSGNPRHQLYVANNLPLENIDIFVQNTE